MEKRTRVLVIDRDHRKLSAVSHLLEGIGCHVTEAATGEQGLQLASERTPDLILLNVDLPDMDGVDVCRRFKVDESLTDSYVILLSDVQTASETQAQALQAGADGYIIRPISNPRLLAPIDALLRLKRAEDTRWASEERYGTIFHNAPIGLYRTAPDGQILMANPTLVQMLGYDSFQQLAERNLESEGYHPDYPRLEFKRRIEAEEQIRGLEAAWIREDGSVLFIRENTQVVRDEDGNTLYYEGSVEDITERKQVEAALQESELKYRTLVETFPDIVLVADYEGRLLFANPSLEAQTGITLEDLQRPREENPFIHPDDRERVQQCIREFILSDEQCSGVIENRLIDKQGRLHWYSGTVSKITYGGAPAIQAISRDITGRKRAEEELRKHRERLEELVQGRTADLRRLVDAMAGREVRMAELKEVVRQLRAQLQSAGLEPVADDPLLGEQSAEQTEGQQPCQTP